MLHPNFAGSIGFCPPCFIIEPPRNTDLEYLKYFSVSPNVLTKKIEFLFDLFISLVLYIIFTFKFNLLNKFLISLFLLMCLGIIIVIKSLIFFSCCNSRCIRLLQLMSSFRF